MALNERWFHLSSILSGNLHQTVMNNVNVFFIQKKLLDIKRVMLIFLFFINYLTYLNQFRFFFKDSIEDERL